MIYVFGDLHLDPFLGTDLNIETKLSKRFYAQFKYLYEFCDKTKTDPQKDILIIAGDIFDSPYRKYFKDLSYPYSFLLYVLKLINKYSKNFCKVYLLVGNHDYTKDKISVLDIFKNKFNNVFIVEEPSLTTIGDKNFIFLPYPKDNCFNDTLHFLNHSVELNNEKNKSKNIIIGHIGLQEGKFLIKVSENYTVQRYAEDSILSIKDFKDLYFDTMLLGHFHEYQQITPNIVYIGSIFCNNFGEFSTKYYVTIDDIIDFHEVEGGPSFETITINKKSDIKKLNSINADFVKIKITSKNVSLENIKKKYKDDIDYKIDYNISITKMNEEFIEQSKQYVNDPKILVETWLKEKKYKICPEILNEVLDNINI